MAVQASFKAALSLGSLAGHIQFPLHFTSCNKQYGLHALSKTALSAHHTFSKQFHGRKVLHVQQDLQC
jgi:hypothetical protein